MYTIVFKTGLMDDWVKFTAIMETMHGAPYATSNYTYGVWLRHCRVALQEYDALLDVKPPEHRIMFKNIEDATAFKLKFGL